MAYSERKVLAPTATPDMHNNQPTAFPGLREATMAPTVASITTNVLPNHQAKMGVFGWERPRTTSSALSVVSVAVIAHSDHASLLAARRLIRVTLYGGPHRRGDATTTRRGLVASSPKRLPSSHRLVREGPFRRAVEPRRLRASFWRRTSCGRSADPPAPAPCGAAG